MQLSGKFFDRSETFAKFGTASPFAWNDLRVIEENGVDAEPCEKLYWEFGIFSDFFKKGFGSEPAVANDECRALEKRNYSQDKLCADAGFSLDPFGIRKLGTGFYGLFKRSVEFLCKRKTCPSSVPEKKDSGKYPAVSENPLCGILFCRMVMMGGASGNLFSSLAVSGIVESDKEPSADVRNWDHGGKKFPEHLPRKFAGIEKIVKLSDSGVFSEENGEFSEYAADTSGTSSCTKCDEERFENAPSISWYCLGGVIDKFVEFHLRLLGLIKGYIHIIADRCAGVYYACCL